MNPLKHFFVLIIFLLTGIQAEAAYGVGGKAEGDFKYCLLNDSFVHSTCELDLFAYFRLNHELQDNRDTTSQYISPCGQILEADVFASPPGPLPQKVLCMLAEDLAKFPDLRKLFDSAENVEGKFVKAWEKLSALTGTREWTRRSVPLLKKMSDKSDEFMEKVSQYYASHQKPTGTGAPPFTHQGTPFDDFEHPDFIPEVPNISNHGKIKYQPSGNQTALNGGSSDFTEANNWAQNTLNGNGQINFVRVPNSTRFKVKAPGSPYADGDDWVECVWQHHQDAKTLMLVPMQAHNIAIPTGSPHTGGAAILDKPELHDLIGFFDSPIY